MRVNAHYADLTDSYLFSSIAHKVSSYQQAHPEADIIRLGIGDVTLPLAPVVVEAMKQAVIEMGRRESFHGYGPEQGYDFLREAIRDYYGERSIQLDMDEIFVSDGAKSDLGNILDLFDRENRVLIPDPVYPVYVDTNVMAGRKVAYLNATASNGFLPLPDPGLKADLIYLCSPNNPTGAVYSREGLKSWVDFALSQGALILFDAAYEAFVADPTLPRSIYEIEGAQDSGLHRRALRLHRRAQGACLWRRKPQQDVAAPSDYEIQRRILCGAARRRRRVYPAGEAGNCSRACLLPRERAGYRPGAGCYRDDVYRRKEFALYLDAVPGGHDQLALF